MAEITTPYSPMHINCTIGQPYGNPRRLYLWSSYWSRLPCKSEQVKQTQIYTLVILGEITYIYRNETHEGSGYSVALGNQVQIFGTNGIYYRYCHLQYGSIPNDLQVGDIVDQNTFIGKMGNTGHSFGTHLHLEASTQEAWACGTFLVPGDSLLFGNTRGTIVIFGGYIPPEPPTPTDVKKSKFPWVLYSRKLRNKKLTKN